MPAPAHGSGSVTIEALPPPGPPEEKAPAAAPPGRPPPVSLAPPRQVPPSSPPGANAPAGKSGAPTVSQKLPIPALSPEAGPADFLRAARSAILAGRTGEARSSLEMAQTRLLSRVIDAGKEREPSDDLAVKQIGEAISALAENDRMNSVRFIEIAGRTIGVPLN